MNSQKPETKAADQDENDHTQPINLVAQRTPVPVTPVTAFCGPSSQSSITQPAAMKPHIEPPKSGLMPFKVKFPEFQTLYFRAPTTPSRQPGPGQVMTAQVASAQHFAARPAFKGFKNVKVGYYQDKTAEKNSGEFNIKGIQVIRMPANDVTQPQSVTGSQPVSGSITSGIVPTVISGSNNRHVPAAVHPVIASGSSSTGSMASIIRGAHQVTQTGHVMHQPYSSHVPRGPAAVASISAAPKSAVATPILRAPHSSTTMTLASGSSMLSSHTPVRARSPTLVTGRTATPPVPVAPSSSLSQVIDLQKSSVGHSVSTNPVQIGLNARTLDHSGTTVRTGIQHQSPIAITKPVNISQPIVQHLQQVSDKGYVKMSTASSVSSVSSNTTPAHQSTTIISGTQSSNVDINTAGVPTITRTAVSIASSSIPPASAYSSSVLPLQSSTQTVAQHVVPTLRPSLVQPQQSVHAHLSVATGPVGPQQTYTVISAKTPFAQGSQAITLAATSARSATSSSSGSVVSNASVLSVATPRPLSTANSVCQNTIPVAKVHPQPLPPASHTSIELSVPDNARSSGGFSAQSQPSSLGATSTPAVTAVTSSVSATAQAVVISEKRSESSAPVRFSSVPKVPMGGGTSPYATPAYFYEQFQGTLAMHPYPVSVNSSNQSFANALQSSPPLRSTSFAQHPGTTNSSNSSNLPSAPRPSISSTNAVPPVQQMSSLMVAPDSSHHHVSLHPSYNTVSGGVSSSEVVATQAPVSSSQYTVTSSSNIPGSHTSTSLVSPSFSSLQSQGNAPSIPNHNTSPRPSILRKRTTDGVNSLAKKNLIAAVCSSESVSPHPDLAPTMNLSSAPSPKPPSDQLKENGTSNTCLDADHKNSVLSAVAIKKEPNAVDKSLCSSNGDINVKTSVPLEVSPRKKPRKQLLAANELIETHSSDGEDEFDKDMKINIKESIKNDENNMKACTYWKRPNMSLLSTYHQPWKSRNNHFMRYCDVKPKEEKKCTIMELANHKSIVDEIQGWKVYHFSTQMQEVVELENTVNSRLSQLLDFIEKDEPPWRRRILNTEEDKILGKLTDLTKGNLQRSKIVQEQVTECEQQMMKIVEHKPHIVELINKYVSRRPVKKKEKT